MCKISSTSSCKYVLVIMIMLQTASVLAQQVCNNEIVRTTPDNRYQDNGDGTVLDFQTGLMWQKCSLGQEGDDCIALGTAVFSWDKALQQVEILNSSGGFAGYSDWRLPNSKELGSLYEDACISPSVNSRLFPNTLFTSLKENSTRLYNLRYYWSSSPSVSLFSTAWRTEFSGSPVISVHSISDRDSKSYVRLVRSSL